MNICLVENDFSPAGGQSLVNSKLALSAAQAGHQVTCLANRVAPDLRVDPNVSWIQMPSANWPIALLGNIRFARACTKWLEKYGHRFDIIIGNGVNTWYPVDLNMVHFVHSSWLQSPVHDSRVGSGLKGWYRWIYSYLNAQLEQRVVARARVVVAVSRKVKQELIEAGISHDTIQVVHNGVDTTEFAPGPSDRARLGLPTDAPLALFAGDIRTRRKNLDSILRALVGVPTLHLAVAGSTDGSPFPALAQRLDVENRTHFLGFRSDVPDLMRAADFFVFPSRYEACTLVLLEAMASGLPIITAQTAGGAELVNDSCGIVLDDPDDLSGLTEALRTLTHEPERRNTMGARARSTSLDHTWAKMADRYFELMRDVADRPSTLTPA